MWEEDLVIERWIARSIIIDDIISIDVRIKEDYTKPYPNLMKTLPL
jgi:hypothetical protein